MPLGIKILLTLVVGATVALLAQIVVLGDTVLPAFEQLERKVLARELRQSRLVIEAEVDKLAAFGRDWAGWDETFLFVANPTTGELAQSDLVYASLASEVIDFFALYSFKGELLWAGVSDRHVEGYPEATAALTALVKTGLPARVKESLKPSVGLMASDSGPLMVAAFPVIPHQTSHQAQGKLVVGRLLDEDLQAILRDKTGLSFALEPWSPTRDAALSAMQIDASADGGLAARDLLLGVLDKPVFVINLAPGENSLDSGRQAVGRSVLTFAFIAIALVIFCFLAIQLMFVRPLALLTHRLIGLIHDENWSQRLISVRKDVIGILAGEINGLLERLGAAGTRGPFGESEAVQFQQIVAPPGSNGEASETEGPASEERDRE